MPITSLRFNNVGPFDEIEFEFDEQVNVFVGPNNSGKTTALLVLAAAIVFPFRIPERILRSVQGTYELVDTFLSRNAVISRELRSPDYDHLLYSIGQIEQDHAFSRFVRHDNPDQLFLASIDSLLTKVGYSCFVPAMRQGTDYRSSGPTTTKLTTIAVLRGFHELQRRLSLVSSDPWIISDESIVQRVIDLDYTSYRREQPAIRSLLTDIASIASEITDGYEMKFDGIGEDEKGLYPQFTTPDGTLPLNVLSQGTQSIIQWVARFLIGYAEYYEFPTDLKDKPGILIIDEIDAHLHPSWQRRIIPTLTKHFPNLQIFCSTHSPLMLAGLKAGQVQLLKRDTETGKVTVSRNENDIVGWSSDEILRGFLDVQDPTDLHTTHQIERLQHLRQKDQLTPEEAEELEKLRGQIHQDLLGGPIAAHIDELKKMLERVKSESDNAASANDSEAARPKQKPQSSTGRRSRRTSP